MQSVLETVDEVGKKRKKKRMLFKEEGGSAVESETDPTVSTAKTARGWQTIQSRAVAKSKETRGLLAGCRATEEQFQGACLSVDV